MRWPWGNVVAIWLCAASAFAQSDAPTSPPVEASVPADDSKVEAPAAATAARDEAALAPAAADPNAQVEVAPASTSEVNEAALPQVAEVSVEPDVQPSPSFLSKIRIHGFVSAGGFKSTENDFIGESERGSLKFFEGGINFSVELTDRLRVGLQFVSRSVGVLSEEVPRLDWGVIDYQWRSWLGMRAGVIKMPLGLYNEYISIDAARTAILLPQSVYPLRNRDALISHTGFALYGNLKLGPVGDLDYQAWLGTLTIPRSALELSGASLDSVDTRYVAGGQLFYRPIDSLRIGATYLRASIDFNITLEPATTQAVIAGGLAPADYDGSLLVTQRPTSFWVASAEYIEGDWLFAAEYSRWLKHQTSRPEIIPELNEDAERFYAMGSYRFHPQWEVGTYYSVSHADVEDRRGRDPKFAKRFFAFQRDLSATLRFDVNEYWLWKIEGHFIDGAADLALTVNTSPKRYWGLALFRTTVTF